MDRTRAHVYVDGRVQGVYYRATAREMACTVDVHGYVRNLEDGRVEAVFEGAKEAVERMVAWCEEGSINAEVKDIDVTYGSPSDLAGFEVEPENGGETIREAIGIPGDGYHERGITQAGKDVLKRLLNSVPHPYDRRLIEKIVHMNKGWHTSSSSSLSRPHHLWIHWQGFDEELYYLYGFAHGTDPSRYLSDYSRRCAKIVSEKAPVLTDKELFYNYLCVRGLEAYVPRQLGYIQHGEFITGAGRTLEATIEQEQRVIVKEVTGGGGASVYVGTHTASGATLLGNDDRTYEIDELLPELDRSVVTEYCEQAAFLDRIFSRSANTIRALAMNPDDGDPFIPAAVQRIGSDRSAPLDSFSQYGLAAQIDLASGALSAAAQRSDRGVTWCSEHPETGADIEGVTIPGWDRITDQLVEIMDRQPELKYVGWDLIVTDPGEFVIIEGNHYPNPRSNQVHEPLLKDARTRRFYRSNGVPV